MISLVAGGFTTFVGNTSEYINTGTQTVETRGPAAQLCSVTKSDGIWHFNTPFRNFTIPALDEMVTTFNENLRNGYAAMQSLTPLGGGENLLTYTILVDKEGSVYRTAMVTTNTKETYACTFDPKQSTSSPNQPSADEFIPWNNSRNGTVVKDASDNSFSFHRKDGCIYSHNMKTTYTNFCLVPGSENRIRFKNQDYYVLHIAARDGGCITGLGLDDGRQVDIFTTSVTEATAQVLPTKWVMCPK
ncbi:hypothetical protein [Ottowia thiooxydans]|uniref:hypothetical protein n=1 Tax=Ottowia thiooxydans TaxID=219182 RepID=UPI0004915960|nr:hypothetical protein [Ottowia thiooxydans]